MANSYYHKGLIFLSIFGMLLWSFPSWGGPLKRDGVLPLYQSHLGRWMKVRYEKGGQIQPRVLRRIEHFMRSRDDGRRHPIDLRLIRLIDHLQDHFQADTVEIISAYRTPEFNRFLKGMGRGTAERSYHLRGMAADIHLDEISEEEIVSYLKRLRLGGVGYYPDNLMVHLDVGPVRSWQQGRFTNRRGIGIFNPDLDIIIRTDHLFYFLGDKLKLSIANPSGISIKPQMTLEHFFRGKWDNSPQPPLKLRGGEGELKFFPSIPYGKYRWKLTTQDGRVQYSNEFYLKRR